MAMHTIELIIGAIALMVAYFFSVTFVGFAEEEVARWAGDETPAQSGFLSGNPFYYLDFFGLLCVLLIGFGWGRITPFNPYNVDEPHRMLKVFLVYISQSFFSLVLALIALITNVFLVGPQSLQFAFWSIFSKNLPLQQLSAAYPTSSSLTLVGIMILLSIVALNTFIATWSLINNAFHYILFVGAEHGHDYMKHAEALAFFGPLVVLILFTGPLRFFLLKSLVHLAYFIASLCGACA